VIATVATIAAAGTLLTGSASLQATLTAPTHAPKIGTHWAYTVRATDGGKPASGKLTVQIVDPLGGHHPVGFGAKKGNVTNVAFKGTFSDFVIWPKSSLGVPLTFQATVASGGTKKVVRYKVTPRG